MAEIESLQAFTLPRRRNSFKKMIYNSLRIKKKPKFETTDTFIEEESPSNVYTIKTTKNCLISHVTSRDDGKTVFGPVKVTQPKECSLVKFFPAEGKTFDPACKLKSLERKRRARQEFSEINHCNLQLFCPEQASQIEIRFVTATVREVLVRVIAPNGEVSDILQPKNAEPALFAPSKVGCGHGKWKIELAVRDGVRFKYLRSIDVLLHGQGCLTYQVDHNLDLKLIEQLWLSFN